MGPILDIEEALRYLGAGDAPPGELRERTEAVAGRLTASLTPRWIWKRSALDREAAGIRFRGTRLVLAGDTAGTMLAECGQAVLLACGLGAGFDAMLRAVQARDMAEAVILDACGSAWVEAGCDAAEREIAARSPGLYLTDRFSPGYGDLPLSIQGEICGILDARRRLGIHVTERSLMDPVKSVTAVIGLAERPQRARIRGCAHCSLRETCAIRRGGGRCAA